MSKKMSKKKKRHGPHYFTEPDTLRLVDCRQVPGERARKACQKWNKYVLDVKAGRVRASDVSSDIAVQSGIVPHEISENEGLEESDLNFDPNAYYWEHIRAGACHLCDK